MPTPYAVAGEPAGGAGEPFGVDDPEVVSAPAPVDGSNRPVRQPVPGGGRPASGSRKWVAPAVVVALVLTGAVGFAANRLISGRAASSEGGQPVSQPAPATTSVSTTSSTTAGSTSPSETSAGASRAFPSNLVPLADVTTAHVAPPNQDAQKRRTTYDAANMLDGRADTTWRMSGDGSGQAVIITLPSPAAISKVGLINGYAKVDQKRGDDRYEQERRITHVTWRLDDGTSHTQSLQDGDRGAQTLDLPAGSLTTRLWLTIEATTPPGDSDFDYTAISELTLEGQPEPG